MSGVVALLLISDGREPALSLCLESIERMVPPVSYVVHVDDADHRLGFAGAIAEGWRRIRGLRADLVLHVEQDFVFEEEVPLAAMAALLARHPYLVQVALKRQAWNSQERAAGGIVELHPSSFEEREDDEAIWTEHRRFLTTNPSLYRASLCERGWPQVPHSEGVFTHEILADPSARFAFWGAKYDPPRVRHVGNDRAKAAHGY